MIFLYITNEIETLEGTIDFSLETK